MVKIIGRIKQKCNLYFCDYNSSLDKAIDNFKISKTVKVINNVVYIQACSLAFFVDLISKENIDYQIITTLN